MLTVRIGKRLTCKRCGYQWHARQTAISMCPTCKSKLFNVTPTGKPRRPWTARAQCARQVEQEPSS